MKRPLTETERFLISQIAGKLPDGPRRRQLIADLKNATAEAVTDDGSRIIFHIAGYARPQYEGQHSFGVEGKVADQDGADIWVDLYADQNDRLLELELIREPPGPILNPDRRSLVLW